jgi:hypothetical protein
MTTRLYRFRPLRRLLDQNELLNQEIFFANPDNLNDPMEGFRDIFWQGDVIVWENLFRHYLLCLEWGYSIVSLGGEEEPLTWKNTHRRLPTISPWMTAVVALPPPSVKLA